MSWWTERKRSNWTRRAGSHLTESAQQAQADRVDSLIRADFVNRTLSMMEVHPDLIRAKQEYRERLRKQFEGCGNANPLFAAPGAAGDGFRFFRVPR
jgi:hypothetical protein